MAWRAPVRLRMAEASAALDAGRAAIAAGETRIDLSAATDVDSSAVALLLAWRRSAGARALAFEGASPALAELAKLYGVDELIGLVPATS
ncbi:STAS domain-containing protein [Derxia lacustris]|uniref:STAS domain-containing protein n=1 Tax=Derxia lacustris TaxID=764842 RepID=UPI000A172A0D|nr:STAS domain-containing protein [Derxia lacustris]